MTEDFAAHAAAPEHDESYGPLSIRGNHKAE